MVHYNVGSTSDIVLPQISDVLLTGHTKEDNCKSLIPAVKQSRKLTITERQLRELEETNTKVEALNIKQAEEIKTTVAIQEYSRKLNDMERQLELAVKERQEEGRKFEKMVKTLKDKEAEGAKRIEYLQQRIADTEQELKDQAVYYRKKIEILHVQLKEQQQVHLEQCLMHMEEKHALIIKVERMQTIAEMLERELNDAKMEVLRSKHVLEHEWKIEALHKQSSEKEAEMKKKDIEIQELQKRFRWESSSKDSGYGHEWKTEALHKQSSEKEAEMKKKDIEIQELQKRFRWESSSKDSGYGKEDDQ